MRQVLSVPPLSSISQPASVNVLNVCISVVVLPVMPALPPEPSPLACVEVAVFQKLLLTSPVRLPIKPPVLVFPVTFPAA